MYLILNKEHFTFHLQYKHSGTFASHKNEVLSYPKNQKMCDPILVTLLRMRPHDSQSSHENATPSSGTSPLASYKEVSPPGPKTSQTLWIQNPRECFEHHLLFLISSSVGLKVKGSCWKGTWKPQLKAKADKLLSKWPVINQINISLEPEEGGYDRDGRWDR